MAAGSSLSDLPFEVIIGILSQLPIPDAVRTSILSRSWRHHWHSIPDIAFNLDDDHDVAAVDHVLDLHSATIQSFSLSVGDYRLKANDLDRYLAALSADPLPLRSLTLDVWGTHISADSLLRSFSNLNHLHLRCCSLPSYGLVGFPVLETLHLSGCTLHDYDNRSITYLISDCPLLQKLTLLDVDCIHLRIRTPNLRSFVFRGCLEGFALASAPLLTTVVFHLHDFFCFDENEELNECNLIQAFGNARSIKKVNMLGYSLSFLENFEIPDRIPDSFEMLKVLTLTVNFSIPTEILVLLCLLRSAPNLHEIKIEGYGQTGWQLGHEFWQDENHLELSKLQTMKLTHISCVEPMLEFIDYILPKARELKIMEIDISSDGKEYGSIRKLSNSKELVLHWRASTRAQIIFTGEFISECAITSSGSDATLSVWFKSASQEEFNELRDHIESKLQGVEDRVRKMETELLGHVKELHCQLSFLLQAIPLENRDAWMRTMVPPEHRDAWMQRFGAAYGRLVSGASDPTTASSTNNTGFFFEGEL